MKKRKNIITVAIDSPAAAGGGTQAQLIAKQYNLLHLDTGRIYRMIGKLKLDNPKKFNYCNLRLFNTYGVGQVAKFFISKAR